MIIVTLYNEQFQSRDNPFVALCSFEDDLENLSTEDCKLFKRSFTNTGLGFTTNNQIRKKLYKQGTNVFRNQNEVYFTNKRHNLKMMKSASPKHALRLMIEYNRDEVEIYENTRKNAQNSEGELSLKPTTVKVSLHNPNEPADLRSNVFSIPLGYSTIVYVTPKARQIDDSAKDLTEVQRGCRLPERSEDLDIFNVYTKEACIFECKLKQAVRKCGCFPWNYPIIEGSLGYIPLYFNFETF